MGQWQNQTLTTYMHGPFKLVTVLRPSVPLKRATAGLTTSKANQVQVQEGTGSGQL